MSLKNKIYILIKEEKRTERWAVKWKYRKKSLILTAFNSESIKFWYSFKWKNFFKKLILPR